MKRTLIIPAVIVVLLVGCHPEENQEQLKAVNRSLEYANGVMEEANNLVYEELLERQKDPRNAVNPEFWGARATQIRQHADSICILIKNIKVELITQSDSLKRDYVDLTKQLHNGDGIGGQLLNKLIVFKDSIPAVFYSGNELANPYRQDQLNYLLRTIPLLPAYLDSLPADWKKNYKKQWLEKSFGRTSALMAMIMLNKIESDVLATEHAFMICCKNQISIGYDSYLKISALAILSSSYIKPGQSIQVSAGLGAFSSASKPTITINGKQVPLSDDGAAQYSFIPTGKPGKRIVPVTFEFIKPDGTKDTVSKLLKYIIADN